MRDLLAGYTPRPTLPATGVTFNVTCRSSPGARGRPHPVTVADNWALTTPHDLGVERIGVALGGTCTCVDLADRLLPAARGYLEHVLRLARARIEQVAPKEWCVQESADRCSCADKTFPSAADAARHLRDRTHWARRYGVGPAAVEKLVRELHGGPLEHRRCPLPHGAADGYLTDPDGLDMLWDAGVHYARVPALVAALSPSGDPVPPHLVIAQEYAADGFAWLEPFAAHGPLVLSWAARTRTRRDARRPEERLAWVEAGVPLPAIADVFAGEAYTLTDARAYAAAVGVSLARAARVLGSWQVGCVTPTLAELVALAQSDPLLPEAPSMAAVTWVRQCALCADFTPTFVQAALALALTGNARDAVTHLRRNHPTDEETA